MTGAPVIPVGMWGTEKVWPRSSRLPERAQPRQPADRPRPRRCAGRARAARSLDADTKRIMKALVDLLPPRTPTRAARPSAEELAAHLPAGLSRRPDERSRPVDRAPTSDSEQDMPDRLVVSSCARRHRSPNGSTATNCAGSPSATPAGFRWWSGASTIPSPSDEIREELHARLDEAMTPDPPTRTGSTTTCASSPTTTTPTPAAEWIGPDRHDAPTPASAATPLPHPTLLPHRPPFLLGRRAHRDRAGASRPPGSGG